jgi:NAD(P)-dependent dehydrogenase (short-subunit alcohol dehydrogenase family)
MPERRDGGTSGLRSFDGAVALVTGAGSGIGAALARGLAARGARVVLADRDLPSARAEAARLPPGSADAVELDVREAEAFEHAVGGTFARHGRLDYLFNNAGIGVGGEALRLSLEDWREAVAVNLLGPVHGIAAAYPRMVAQGFGHVVNTASMAAFMATPLATPYGATKSALASISRALRLEAARHGVRVSALCPGVIRTPILVDGGRFGRIASFLAPQDQSRLWERLRPMDVDVFARRALAAVARNRAVIVIPGWWRALRLLDALAPSLADRLAARQLREIRGLLESGPR